jgi:hypothetical protein
MTSRESSRKAPPQAVPRGEPKTVAAPRVAAAPKPAKPPRKRRPPFVL